LIRQAGRDREVRIILLDRSADIVAEDSEGRLKGKPLAIPPAQGSERPLYRTWTGRDPDGQRLVFLYVPQLQIPRLPRAEPPDRVVLAVPEATVAGAWRDLLPGLLGAGTISFAASLIVAALLARWIARPLVALTHASEAMARGEFEQEIPVRRRDEVGRLATAFNRMAREVGRGHQQMRSLIANVSHDLKTPLTSILGFSQALRDGDLGGEANARETATIIHDEAERVRALVDNLLFLSEIEAGQIPVQRNRVDVGVLVARSARRFARRFEEQGITFTLDAPETAEALGDAAKIERILDNLLDNALKYTPPAGIVTLRVDTGERLSVTVSNTGSTIPAEELPRLFDRFYRLDRARSSRTRGSGLGLSIARELAGLMGGSLEVESEGGQTAFRLSLPGAGTPVQPPPPLSLERPGLMRP
jgi:signal transduction histidine kinase